MTEAALAARRANAAKARAAAIAKHGRLGHNLDRDRRPRRSAAEHRKGRLAEARAKSERDRAAYAAWRREGREDREQARNRRSNRRLTERRRARRAALLDPIRKQLAAEAALFALDHGGRLVFDDETGALRFDEWGLPMVEGPWYPPEAPEHEDRDAAIWAAWEAGGG